MEKYEDVDIKRIIEIIFSKKILIILIFLLSITLGYVYSYYYKKPEYKSSVTILLVADENKANKELTQTDLNINSSLISTYSSIAKSTNVIQSTIDNLGLDMYASKLQNNVEAAQIDKTQFLKITVKNDNPETAKNIANELAKVFAEQIKKIYNIENISIVDEAEIENKPCNINHIKDMTIFIATGIFISMILVMIIYLFDDTIKHEKDIEKNIKLKNIGSIPVDKDNNQLIIENNPKSHIVECIKTIRTNILYSTKKKTILITSCRPKEGKSWIINNLAISFAQANKKVILVDTDLRKANNTNEILNVEKSEGLSDFIKEISDNKLENLKKSKNYIKETKIPNLHFLQNGTLPPNPSELITSDNMKKLLDLLKIMYDVVLLDGTSCMVVSDSIALSSMVDSTILVAESKKIKIKDLKNAKKSIEDVNGKILGVILNKSEIQKGKYYGKRYGYYYGQEIKEIETIEEKIKNVSLEEIIKIAEENVKIAEENLHKEEVFKEDNNILKEDKEISKEEIKNEINKEINYQIKNIRNEFLTEIKKIKNIFIELKKDNTKKQIDNITNDICNLKQVQDQNNNKLLEKIENINELQQNNNSHLIEQFISEINNLKSDIKKLKEAQDNNKSELLEKIDNMKYDERLTEISNKIQKNEIKNTNNIISFESLKEKRKSNKKVFKTNESISYEELERLSTFVMELNGNTSSIDVMSN